MLVSRCTSIDSTTACVLPRTFPRIAVAAILLWTVVLGESLASDPADRPNVVLVLTDDQGYGDLACHGNPVIRTPNLDRLYGESIRLTDFHVNPFCSPTRAALMTGRFSDRTHVRTTIQSRNHLARGEVTMAEFFKGSGYRTGHFGKWHLGRNYPYRPIDRGFDQWVGHGDGGTGTASDFWNNDKMNDSYYRNGHWEEFRGFSTDIYFDEAMKFIKAGDGPFFVYLATNVPHGPWNVLPAWRKPYEGKLPPATADFFATISRFDWNLGRLRAFLHQRGLSKNTILVYLTDNGTSGGDRVFNAGMRGRKGSVYEGGHRVPCFLHWPAGGLNRPANVDRLTGHVDLLPTLIDLCRLSEPPRKHLQFDGRSLVPLIKNPKADWPDRTFVLHSQNARETPQKWIQSLVATQRWRLVQGKELYDVQADPGQARDIAGQHPDVVADLRRRYERHWDRLKLAENPYPRPIVGSPHQEETWLACDAWILDRERPMVWDQGHVRAAVKNNGFWPIEVAAGGTYRFEVRRWPKEADRPLAAALPASDQSDVQRQGKPVFAPAGKAIPVAKVRLQVGGADRTKPVAKGDTSALFELPLAPGPAEVRTWLIDEEGRPLCGAYYVYVRRVNR